MVAGNKDTNMVGDVSAHSEKALADIPRFTPFNCNFFKQTIAASAQSKLLSKDRGPAEQRLIQDNTHPLYDKKKHK